MYLFCVVAVVGLAGAAWAGSYDDAIDGNWNADLQDTWAAGIGVFPGAGDTAVIDTNVVTLNVDVNLGVTSIDVQTNGRIGCATGTFQQAGLNVTLSGGRFGPAGAYDWGEKRYDGNLILSAATTSALYSTGNGEQDFNINGTLSGSGTLETVNQHGGAGGRIFLNAASPGFSGTVNHTWGTLHPKVTGALGTGDVHVTVGSQYYGGLILWADQPNNLYADPGGWIASQANSITAPIFLNGGRLTGGGWFWAWAQNTVDYSGPISLTADSKIGAEGQSFTISGKIDDGGGNYALAVDRNTNRSVTLSYAGNTYGGGTDVTSGTLNAAADGALGSGDATVSSGGTLAFSALQAAPPPVYVNAGGILRNWVNRNGGADPLDLDFEVDGGAFSSTLWWNSAQVEYSGVITLAGSAEARVDDKPIHISGELTGAGKLTKTGGSTLVMSNVGTSFTGGVEVAAGTAQVDAAGSLGSGEAVAAGGTILSNIDDAFASAAQVVSDENGTVDLNSTENNATLRIKPGGALKVSSGSTVLNYTGTPIGGQATVYVEAGCILYEGYPHPTADQFEVGDGGFGAFKATTTGDHTVGKYSGTIYRGLANTAGTATFSGSVTEAAATGGDPDPTEGIGMLATGPATFQYQGSTFTTVNTNTIKFYGAGAHVIQDFNTFNNDLEKFGTGKVEVEAVSGITGKTLTVRGGYLEIGDPDALGGAVVNLEGPAGNEPGGIFRQERYLAAASGTINVKAGAGVCLVGDDFSIRTDLAGGATWNFDPGSQVVLPGTGGMVSYTTPYDGDLSPAWGKASFLLYNGSNAPDGLGLSGTKIAGGLQMGEQTRLTIAPWDADTIYGHRYESGDLTLALGQQSFRVCAPTDHTLAIKAVIDLDLGTGHAGTMVVGDTNDFHAVNMDGTQWVDIGQAGIVQLEGQTNNIGHIDVQAGTLQIGAYGVNDFQGAMGNAKTVRVAEGATVTTYYVSPLTLNTVFTGNGTVQPAGTLVLAPSGTNAAGIAPGDSAGRLTVDGNLTLSNDGLTYATLDTEVVTDGGGTPQAKDDYDQLAVTGNLSVGGGNLAVTMNVPSVNYKPANLSALDIATCGGTLNTTPFNAVAAGVFDSVDPSPAVRAAVAAHWTIEADDVTYDGTGGKIVLDASNWTGFTGDADLSDFVDLADLSILAFNWESSTDMTWLTADFDLTGTVDLADLSALAFHWEQSASAGAPPVPEPMTVGLLVLGGAALLRRRRR